MKIKIYTVTSIEKYEKIFVFREFFVAGSSMDGAIATFCESQKERNGTYFITKDEYASEIISPYSPVNQRKMTIKEAVEFEMTGYNSLENFK